MSGHQVDGPFGWGFGDNNKPNIWALLTNNSQVSTLLARR